MNKIGKLAREQGVLAQSIAAALSDGSINNDELSVIRKDAYDLIRITATLLAMAEKQYRKRNNGANFSTRVRDAALGRWKRFNFPSFRHTGSSSEKKSQHGPCPICGGTDRFRCDDKQGKGTWICNHCRAGDGFSLDRESRGLDYPSVSREVGAILRLYLQTPKLTDEDRKRWREKAEAQQKEAELKQRKEQEAAAKRAARLWAAKSCTPRLPVFRQKTSEKLRLQKSMARAT